MSLFLSSTRFNTQHCSCILYFIISYYRVEKNAQNYTGETFQEFHHHRMIKPNYKKDFDLHYCSKALRHTQIFEKDAVYQDREIDFLWSFLNRKQEILRGMGGHAGICILFELFYLNIGAFLWKQFFFLFFHSSLHVILRFQGERGSYMVNEDPQS